MFENVFVSDSELLTNGKSRMEVLSIDQKRKQINTFENPICKAILRALSQGFRDGKTPEIFHPWHE